MELTVDQRIVEAAALIQPGHGAVTGWAALRWGGGRWFDGSTASDPCGLPVDLSISRDLRTRPGIALCEERWVPREVVVVDGLPVATLVRSTAFAMRYAAGVRQAVRVLDLAAYDDLVSIQEMADYIGPAPRHGLSSWTGVPRAREAVLLGNENAWSPQEVTMQLVWVIDAGLPPPLLNQPVFDRLGRHVGTPDLLDVQAGLVGEYESAIHLEGSRRAKDIRREEAFRNVGLECFTMTAGDASDPARTAARMREARARAGWLGEQQRAWTIQPPPWWIPTLTVKQRRALTAEQRARLLRYRSAA